MFVDRLTARAIGRPAQRTGRIASFLRAGARKAVRRRVCQVWIRPLENQSRTVSSAPTGRSVMKTTASRR